MGKKRLVCTVYAYAIGLRSPDTGDNSLLGNAICKTVPFFFYGEIDQKILRVDKL